MTTEKPWLTAGELIYITTGDYSDYRVRETFVALETVTRAEMLEIADELNQRQQDDDNNDDLYGTQIHDVFLARLIRRGWLAMVPMREIHIGSYGGLDVD